MHLEQAVIDCIAACQECIDENNLCYMRMVGHGKNDNFPSSCLECAAICRLCISALKHGSPFAMHICKLCAEICLDCAKQCSMHDGLHCRSCEVACRRCADACRALAA